MTLSDCDLQDKVTKLAKTYSSNVSSNLYRQLLAFTACVDSFTQKAKGPQDIECHHESGNVCFPDVVTAYTIHQSELTWKTNALVHLHGDPQTKLCTYSTVTQTHNVLQ